MRTMKYFLTAGMTMCLMAGMGVFRAADEDKPKYTIEEIMEKAHKAPKGKLSLFKQVVAGKADEEKKKQLLEYYQELAKNKPEKGDLKDWQRRTNGLVKTAKDIVDGKDGAAQRLAKTVDCGGCHKLHKGE